MTITIAVVGGKLQGTEAVYLACKAGFRTLVLDKNPASPAADLCHEFLRYEFKAEAQFPAPELRPDVILPAIEDDIVLPLVHQWAEAENIPLAFDLKAYALSCSKLKSDRLFADLGLPAPGYWPDCVFPLVVKPDQASGSQGVEIFQDKSAFDARFGTTDALKNTVIQEYLEGPSYSIEVLGAPGSYLPLQVTDLGMDDIYDCNKVIAPTELSAGHIRKMEEMAVKIAQAIDLKGIMDLEVILNRDELKLIEIDARLPSQTPMTVFHSTGINMVAMLADLFLGGTVAAVIETEKPAMIEHIMVEDASIKFAGEHIMGQDGPLHIEDDFFGADEAVTSFAPGKNKWVATLVFTGTTRDDMLARRDACIERIRQEK